MPADNFDYARPGGENVELLQALIDDAESYTKDTNSRNATILKSIINNTEYTEPPQSEIEELLLELKAVIGGQIEVDELIADANGTYDAGLNKAFNPVTVAVPLDHKTITANGVYSASTDDLAGYDEVTVDVEGYQIKSLPNTPTSIATITDGTPLPMPSLKVGIEATQSGSGDPSPTNIRPISGWSSVHITDMSDFADIQYFKGLLLGTYGFVDLGSLAWTSSTLNRQIALLPDSKPALNNNTIANIISTKYPSAPANDLITYPTESLIAINDNKGVMCRTPDNSTPTGYLVYELATPTTPTITDAQFNSLLTAFDIDGQTTSISLGKTVYGGSWENDGTLTETMGMLDLGDLNWSYVTDSDFTNGGYFRSVQYSDMSNNTINILCDSYESAGVQGKNAVINKYGASANNIVYTANSSNRIYILDSAYTDGDAFKTAMSGVKLVYELATPTTTTLTPTQISTILGTNNIFADCGEILDGSYFAEL